MSRSYAAMTALVVQKLQSGGTADYSVAEVDYQIEETLKEFATYKPHVVEMVFKLETRTGVDVTGTASKLTDTVKAQFLAADTTQEKVVHNLTDNTWAVAVASTVSTSILPLSADIMDANEEYAMYNTRCSNKRQIYIGSMLPEVLGIDSIEYPKGTKRNWTVNPNGVVEIDVDYVPDTNMNVTNLPNVEVVVRFLRPHVLTNLTDLSGFIAGTSAVAGATTMSVSGLTASATVESGTEFYVATHRQGYVITADTTASTAGIASVAFYPPLESAAGSALVVSFEKSTLKPCEEEIFADICAARLAINKAPKYINNVVIGASVWQSMLTWGERRLSESLDRVKRTTPPKTKKRFSTD